MSILLDKPNPYGFQVDISHPQIAPLYQRFKAWKGVPEHMPLGDDERLEFEAYIIRNLKQEEKR